VVWSNYKIDEDWERKLREREKREYGERERERERKKKMEAGGRGVCSFFFKTTRLQSA